MMIRSLARTGILLAAALAAAPLASAQVSVWSIAGDGETEQLFEQLQGLNDQPELASLKTTGLALADAIHQREVTRAEAIAEVNTELTEHLAEAAEADSVIALSEALRSAVELQMLTNDLDVFHARPEIIQLVADADRAANQAETDGDWLLASELYYRLRVLFEETGRYEEDARRQARRLAMIRLYTPEQFWELRNDRRVRDGEDPLPPYNAFGDRYEDKLAGISYRMIHRALSRSADYHVDGTNLRELMLGGLDAVATMSNTPELESTFSGLGDAEATAAFQSEIANIRRAIELQDEFDGNDLTTVLKRVINANDQTISLPLEPLLHEFGNGSMTKLDDFSAIIWPDELRRFQRNTQGSFVGVGIQIQLDEQFNIKVVTPLEGTPAHRAGIRPDDRIKKVDGRSTVGFTIDQAVDVITGPINTDVTLTIERESTEGDEKELIDIDLNRTRIPLRSVKGWERTGPNDNDWEWFIDAEHGIGYVRLTQFVDSTADDFDDAIESMRAQGLNGLVLDLRYNPGGLLNQAVEICSRFIPHGNVVTTHDANDHLRDSEPVISVRKSKQLYDIPVIVLVNQNSASASEIVAGAIQDYAHNGVLKGLVVGARSFGKGSVQNVWRLNNSSAMKLTTQYYKLPNGRLIHRKDGASDWGIEPDLTIEMLPSQQLDSWALRQSADVLPIDENGNVKDDPDRPDPNTLISDGMDLQLHTALVILKSEAVEQNQMRQSMGDPNSPTTN